MRRSAIRYITRQPAISIPQRPVQLSIINARPQRQLPSSSSRVFTTTAFKMIQPAFSEGSDEASMTTDLSKLLREEENGGRWELTTNGRGLERTFRFKTFKKTWEFMNAVAAQCAVEKHHPEWSNVYNTTFIRWTTHSPLGLSAKDTRMALFCDEQALAHGVLTDDAAAVGAGKQDVGRGLADRVATEGGDCCVPKTK